MVVKPVSSESDRWNLFKRSLDGKPTEVSGRRCGFTRTASDV